MKLLNSYRIWLMPVLVGVLLCTASCSVKKNNILSREYHKTLAHYNGYFNARERVKQGAKTLATSQVDRYDRILSVFKYGDPVSAKSVFPDMDEAIKKVSLVIQRHSMEIDGKERNRWIPQSYLIIGLAQFYKHETWTAIESFQYITAQYRTDPIRYESLLWLTQCYLRLGKMPDAEYLLTTFRDDPKLPVKLRSFYNAVYADYFLLQNDYEQAIVHLEKAAASAKKQNRIRYTFILGQIYQKQGEYQKAVSKYDLVIKSTPPYEMSFNARINRAMCIDVNSPDGKDIRRILVKMLSDDKNIEYHDQIYYALAEISMKENNVPEAIDFLNKSIESSLTNTNQKALSYLKLAEIYFKKPEYKLAQAYYDSTAANITQDHPDYATIINIRDNLTKLIENLNIIYTEDSLQAMSTKSQAEIEMIIDERIKRENDERLLMLQEKKAREEAAKEEKQQMEGDPFFNQQQSRPAPGAQTGGAWYFANQAAVSFGFNEFIRIWGNRKLEDNWRRSNRTVFAEAESGLDDEFAAIDSAEMIGAAAVDSLMAANSAKRKKSYLDAIPVTPEMKEKSDDRIVEAYYNVGLIYKEQLKDNKEAGINFETLMQKYPDNEYKIPTIYNLYRVYLALDDLEKAEYYKNIILTEYGDTDYAKIILNPNFYQDQLRKVAIQKVFYENTYRAYLNKQYTDVIERKAMADSLFPGSELAPKFEFLKALAIGQTRTIPEFEASLQGVVASYPKDTVSYRAKEILSLINPAIYDRKDTVSTGGGDLPSNIVEAPKSQTNFKFKADTLQNVLLIFPNNNVIGSNELKVAISNYNAKYYSVKKLQITNSFIGTEYQFVMIRQFNDKQDGVLYLDGLLSDPEALQGIDVASLNPVIISPDNLLLLMQTRDLTGYDAFYQANYLDN